MNKTEVKQSESKYAKKLKLRRRLSHQLGYSTILTWPELLALGVKKNK